MAEIDPVKVGVMWQKMETYMVFDASVNMGVGQSIRLLQKSLGCVSDGVIGKNTMKAIQDMDVKRLIGKYSDQKEQFYRSLKLFSVFGNGWIKRNVEVQQNALAML